MDQNRHVDKPWGFEIWWAHTDLYAGKLLQVEEGHRLSLQYHRLKDESCYLLSGHVRLVKGPTLDDLTTVELRPGASWRNRPGEIHTIEAVETSVIIEASTPELYDVVRLLDDYERPVDDIAASAECAPPTRFLDKEQVAKKLQLRRDQVSQVLGDQGFPKPTAYFRGRHLWEEEAVDAWLHRPSDAEVVSTARAG
jgi:mannose-6-phosphate isomerase